LIGEEEVGNNIEEEEVGTSEKRVGIQKTRRRK
jgi:hypothetical protein